MIPKRMGDNGEGSEDFAKKVVAMMRDFSRAALDDARKPEADLALLDGIFDRMAGDIYKEVLSACGKIYNDSLATMPEERKRMLGEALVKGQFNPEITLKIDIAPQYADFFTSQIMELPGYIKLHEAARRLDVAIDVSGLTREESHGLNSQPRVVVDVLTRYADGAKYGYPALPETDEEIPAAEPAPQSSQPRGGKMPALAKFKM